MDSSGSMGSSSGGGEEYDSRVGSVSAFFGMSNPLSHIGGSVSNVPTPRPTSPSLQPPPPEHHHRLHQTSPMFDPLPSYVNFDMVWPKNPRSEANCSGFGDGFTTNAQQSFAGPPSFSTEEQRRDHHQTTSSEKFLRTAGLVQRNPKKRSRASRRAPTTVLTTDTTNFRAMVQEFTGIPAPPFSSPFPRTKLDLFGSSSSNGTNGSITSSPLLTSSYLLRPFAQRLHSPLVPPFLTNTNPSFFSTSNILSTLSPTTTNYQQQLNPQNLQNPPLNFQTLIPLPKPQQTPLENNLLNDPQFKMGVSEGFGLGHGLQSLVSSSTPKSDLLQSVNDDSQQATHTKVNCPGSNSSSLEFGGDKRQLEINVSRSEGLVESWINCSSDP